MHEIPRLASGISGLDKVLAGGFITGASYIIQGRPGAGKTILSNQIACAHVAGGGRVLYVTLLSESHERLFQSLDSLSFFDRGKLGSEIIYVSVFQTLRDEGLDAVVKLLRKETKRQDATLLVFDGLLNARDRADTDFDVKTFVAEVQGQAAFVGCTVLFLTSSRANEVCPEHTMVDGVIELTDTLAGARTVRQLQVRKSRGSKALGGLHKFEITDEGITVFPRIETLVTPEIVDAPVREGCLTTGIPNLDALIGGGFPVGSVTLLAGPTGSGKTTIGLHFLSQSTEEEPGLHFGFFETPQRLRAKARALGFALAEEGDPSLTVEWTPLADNILDKLAHRLIDRVRAQGVRRLFIDGLGGFERAAVYRPRLVEFFASLMDQLRADGVTTLATWEIRQLLGSDVEAPATDISAILDNMILLRRWEEDHRSIRSVSVQKMRDRPFNPAICAIDFTEQGLVVGGPLSDRRASSPVPPNQG
ncbi:ATPase domain-containing protein [Sphingobium lignivorans]|uniref:non-specific serine/threonine protein kinase n=1 Tax=Sphingobium lignivorans TaxID=2735886 RepID=A0ABR6NC06_9SPHN|nr:ATPase domain-containing protein [Sphingobium lignivorans]MBB5984812.1 circadian clock protein KaiC [Sphingobium lignivorans]